MENLNKWEKAFVVTLLQREIRKNQKFIQENPKTLEAKEAEEAKRYAQTICEKIEKTI